MLLVRPMKSQPKTSQSEWSWFSLRIACDIIRIDNRLVVQYRLSTCDLLWKLQTDCLVEQQTAVWEVVGSEIQGSLIIEEKVTLHYITFLRTIGNVQETFEVLLCLTSQNSFAEPSVKDDVMRDSGLEIKAADFEEAAVSEIIIVHGIELSTSVCK